jgi:hypothetical protein
MSRVTGNARIGHRTFGLYRDRDGSHALRSGHAVMGLDTDLYERCSFAAGGNIAPVPYLRKDVRDVTCEDLEGSTPLSSGALSNDLSATCNRAQYEINIVLACVSQAGKANGRQALFTRVSCSNLRTGR